jgi:hypothetical protein
MMEMFRTQQIREAKQDEKFDKMMEAFMRLIPAKHQELVPDQSQSMSPNYQATTNRPPSPRVPPTFQPAMAEMDTTYTGDRPTDSVQRPMETEDTPPVHATNQDNFTVSSPLPTTQSDATEGDYSYSEFELRNSHDSIY